MEKIIEHAWSDRSLTEKSETKEAIFKVIKELDKGNIRVANQKKDKWIINDWVKKAIILYFTIQKMETHKVGPIEFYDKIPLKNKFKEKQVRVVPNAIARFGSYVSKNVIMMPSFINIGAYVGAGTMVDTWATVGSCAQIGRNVHLSGGVGIGGVLEPPNAKPVIVEDGAFVGSRCIVVEGTHIGKEAVIGANVVLTASTPIIDVTGETEKVTRGFVPPRSVVVPGTRTKSFPSGDYALPCALIIGERSESTDKKVSLNEALRDFSVAV